MISPADLVQLPKGQAFALIEGGQLYKVRLPLFDPDEQIDLPTDIDSIAASMRQVYESHAPVGDSITVEGKGIGF